MWFIALSEEMYMTYMYYKWLAQEVFAWSAVNDILVEILPVERDKGLMDWWAKATDLGLLTTEEAVKQKKTYQKMLQVRWRESPLGKKISNPEVFGV